MKMKNNIFKIIEVDTDLILFNFHDRRHLAK